MLRWPRRHRAPVRNGGLDEAARALATADQRLTAAHARDGAVSRLIHHLVELEEPNHVSERITEMLRRGYGTLPPRAGDDG